MSGHPFHKEQLVHHFLSTSAKTYGDKNAIVYGKTQASYCDLAGYAHTIAHWLLENGLNIGDRVAILTDNPIHYVSCYFGILQAGGIVVGLNTQTTERTLGVTIDDCTPSFVLISERSRKYLAFAESLPSTTAAEIDTLLRTFSITGKNISQIKVPLSTHDLAQIIYTSGTTGKPKGVMLTHGNLIANTLSTVEYLQLSHQDTLMAVLPFFYSYGNSLFLTHIAVGASLIVNQSFVYPNVILDQMVKEKVTGLSGVPSTFALLMHRSAVRDYTFPCLRYLTQAGAAMSPSLANQLNEIFPNIDIYIMYGQTEAAPRLSYLAPEELKKRPGSIGRAIPGVTLEVLKNDGTPAGLREVGEIVASGANIMKGYWQRPIETELALRDGKLWTGDLAYYDEDGFLYMVSRKSDMIKCGSHRIAPKEIEEVLLELEGLVEVAVTGVEDTILGEIICAYLVKSQNNEMSEKDIMKYCKQNLPSFKVPHKIIFLDELPKSNSGKIQKNLLC